MTNADNSNRARNSKAPLTPSDPVNEKTSPRYIMCNVDTGRIVGEGTTRQGAFLDMARCLGDAAKTEYAVEYCIIEYDPDLYEPRVVQGVLQIVPKGLDF